MSNINLPEGFDLETRITPIRRLIVMVNSRPGKGKTNFCLTAPDPIAYIDMDTGTEGVIEKFTSTGKKVYRKRFDYHSLSGPDVAQQAQTMWEVLKRDFIALVKNPKVKTVVVDTESEMWELARLARLGKLTQVMPHHYGPVNAEYMDMVRLCDNCHKNFIFTQKQKEKYVNDKWTGGYMAGGFKGMEYIAQVVLDLWHEDGEFGATITKCRLKPEMEGEIITGDQVCFDYLEMMVFDM